EATRTFSLQAHHLLAHGITCEQDLFLREITFHSGIRDADPLHTFREHAVRSSRITVLLLDQRGHAHALCRCEQRSAGISADTDSNMRTERSHETARLQHAAQQTPGQSDVLQWSVTLKAADGKTFDRETGRRHLLHFHLSSRAHEQEL